MDFYTKGINKGISCWQKRVDCNYSYFGIKIHASVFNELLESIFFLLLVVEAFFLQEVVEMLKEVVISCQEIR